MLTNYPPSSIKSPLGLIDDSVRETFKYVEIQRKMNETIMKRDIQPDIGKISLTEPSVKHLSTSSQSTEQGASTQASKTIEGSITKSTEI